MCFVRADPFVKMILASHVRHVFGVMKLGMPACCACRRVVHALDMSMRTQTMHTNHDTHCSHTIYSIMDLMRIIPIMGNNGYASIVKLPVSRRYNVQYIKSLKTTNRFLEHQLSYILNCYSRTNV